jgi:SAM-dependent methyltransferase
MFDQLKTFDKKRGTFVDLGSGDGRVVFAASHKGYRAIGYEFNPLLHALAQFQRALRPNTWSTTRFVCKDMWKVDLRQVDVCCVYGLTPIMTDLGNKLKNELRPGSFVVSNVFAIPGWTPLDVTKEGTYLYQIPQCFQVSKGKI